MACLVWLPDFAILESRFAARSPHTDVVVKLKLERGKHSFTLIAIVGGKGLSPTPGELAVSFGAPGELERLLGPDGSPHLTDAEWEAYVAGVNATHEAADVARRRSASEPTVAAWRQRHGEIRPSLADQAAPDVPKVSARMPVYNDIDRFLGARLEAAKTAPTALTADLECL